jgi:hypothetical protein
LALSFPNTIELPHFKKASFRVNKKIFATLDVKKSLACLLLSQIDQSVFLRIQQKKSMLKDALTVAYKRVHLE